MRAHAYAHSPFYQHFHRGLFDRPLAELPVLTKADLMAHFDELVTDRALHLDAVRAFATTQAAGRSSTSLAICSIRVLAGEK